MMQRILLAVGGAAAFCAIATLLLQLAISRGLPVDQLVLITAIATLLLAVAAAVMSYRAVNRTSEIALELERLSRSMDAAIKDVSARGDRDAAVFGDLSATVSRKLEALSAKVSSTDDHNDEPDAGRQGTAKRGKHARKTASAATDFLEQPGVEVALRRAAAAELADLSLQPIIAAGRGAAGGFEVYFHIQPDEGTPVNIRRLSHTLPDFDMAAFERLAAVSATEAARKRSNEINERTPLHVAVSEALLHDGLEFAAVLDIFRLHPALARSIVVSLPADLAVSDDLRAPLEILTGLGAGLAVEEWDGTVDGLDKIKQAGCSFIKLSANRLLDKTGHKGEPKGAELISINR